ncbi:MAG: reverse transcriptase family protein [Sedimenticola sp.]
MTWNATGIMSSSSYLCDVLSHESVDVCGISEHWLFDYNIHFMDHINSNYVSYAKADADLAIPGTRRIGKGGVGLMWKRCIDQHITPIDIDDDRIIGIQYEISKHVYMYIFQVYLPCSNHPIHEFREYLASLHELLCIYKDKGVVVMMGDYNAHINGPMLTKCLDNRGRDLLRFIDENNLVAINTLDMCVGAGSTFVSYDESSESLIDHILVCAECLDRVVYCEVLDDSAMNVSRHRPVVCDMISPNEQDAATTNTDNTSAIKINWKKASADQLSQYSEVLKVLLSESLTNLQECDSTDAIDATYACLVQCMCACSEATLPKSKFKAFLKPYWNDDLSKLHRTMKNFRRVWISEGRPRESDNISCRNYKVAKREFRVCHRNCVEIYEQDLLTEIDTAAEFDSRHFWTLFNSRRKRGCTSAGSEIKFDGATCRDAESIANHWGEYFEELYRPHVDINYDSAHKLLVEDAIHQYKTNQRDNSSVTHCDITPDEVHAAVKLCQRKKSGGGDMIVYEHIIHGGEYLTGILARFFSAMLKYSYTPPNMKHGIVITLHKGGRKRKDDPNNYRGITLSSCLLKLYERLIYLRIYKERSDQISALQGGFQKGLSCIMTSFLLRECISYSKEQGSKLYVCFLDSQKAFDKVWHDGLFFKLNELGISEPELNAIMNMYDGMTGSVRYKHFNSKTFKVLQGTRQGGIISPFFYLVYIDALLRELEHCNCGMTFYDTNCSSPTVADDMVLVSYSKNGLQTMMNICNEYSCKWRYKYNCSKCNVIVFHESKNNYTTRNRMWRLGNEVVEECVNYTHLGIICNKYLDSKQNVLDASTKIRGTFMSIINSGIHNKGLHPLTSKKIYERIVLPRALYGCELWNNIIPADISTLERAHRQCIKYMQGLPKRTRSDIAMGLIGSVSVEAEIDRCKLRFLSQLIALPTYRVAKQIFVNRLTAYNQNPASASGFIPDIYRILLKYGLRDFLENFIESGLFPVKHVWKYTVNNKIQDHETTLWHTRTDADIDLVRFKEIHQSLSPCALWTESVINSHVALRCKSAVYLIAKMYSDTWSRHCDKCGFFTNNMIIHCMYYCMYSEHLRQILWKKIIQICGMHVFDQFTSLHIEQQIHVLCSASHILHIDVSSLNLLKDIGIWYLHSLKLLFSIPSFS